MKLKDRAKVSNKEHFLREIRNLKTMEKLNGCIRENAQVRNKELFLREIRISEM